MIVTKFGGSSVADSTQFKKIKAIIDANPARRVVVVSAPGKRFSGDTKVTDYLYTLGSHLKYGVPDDRLWNAVVERYKEIKESLNLSIDIEAELREFSATFSSDIDQNCLVSRGEYFCARLMSNYLGFTFVDAADLMCFSYDGTLDIEESEKRVCAAFEKYGSIVVPGFYGAYPNGDINLFSRGGSDITGSYLARFLGASIYENWTDISGIRSADPRLADNPKAISRITYEELRELSYMGASVLHEDSILPVQECGIAINLLNTNDPEHPGTIITQDAGEGTPVTGIAAKKGFMSFIVHKKHMSSEVGFFRKVLAVFERYNISIDHTPTGMDMLGIIVSEEQVAKHTHSIISEIESTLGATVTLERDISLVAVVGRNMAGQYGICANVFGILCENKINVKMIAQSPDELNIIVGVDSANHAKAIRALYEGLCKAELL
jgi:aspartate kinase